MRRALETGEEGEREVLAVDGEVLAVDGEALAVDGEVLAVHFGRSASCSSIGSFVDFLFVSSVVGAAVIAAVSVMVRESEAPDEGAKAPTRSPDERERED